MKHFKHFIAVALLFITNILSAQIITQTVSYSGTSQTLAIPGCVSQVSIICYGAKGANGASTASAAVGGAAGQGAMATGIYSMIASGTTLNIFVGGAASGSVAGYNGGGSGNTGNSGAGGGASDVRIGGTALANRVIVAGGGGGGGNAGCVSSTITGGAGGAGGGGNGTNGINSKAGQGGQGAIGTNGGAAGIGCSFASGNVGTNGVLGQAGTGGYGPNVCSAYVSGGGGGGGYFGGGGGGGGTAGTTSCTLNDQGAGGGGAGGTNYFSSAFTTTSVTNGVNNGNGYVVISYSVNPSPSISVNSGSICSNNSFVIVPSGANSYTITGGSFTVGPLATTAYSISGDFSGCPASNIAVSTVSVYTTPTISVNSGSICTGSVFSITPTGANSYTFQGGSANVSPLVNSTYTVTGISINGCNSNVVTSTVNVTATPVVTASTTQILTCSQSSIILAGAGAISYTWTGPSIVSGANSASVTVSAPGTYSLQGYANGCTSSLIPITVNQNTVAPTLSLAVSLATICNGSSATLIVVGADSYSWTTGSASASISVNPSVTTIYSVTGTTSLNGCSSTGSITLHVNPTPTVTILSPMKLTCINFSVGLSASVTNVGITSYTWTGPSVVTGSNIASPSVVSPGVYSVSASVDGCMASPATVTVLQNTVAPSVSLTTSTATVCSGSSLTLTATGADAYNWSTGAGSASVSLSPSATTVYSVVGTTTLNGCSNLTSIMVTVTPIPTVSISSPMSLTCINFSVGLSASVTGSGVTTYTWSGPSILSGSNSANAFVNATGIYSLDVIVEGCSALTTTVSVLQNTVVPALTVSPASISICSGNSQTLIASGADIYNWTTGATSGTLTLSPTITAIYAVTGTSTLNGCTAIQHVTVLVNALPSLSITTPTSMLCIGETTTLTASGASTYSWLGFNTTNTLVVNPTTTTSYTLIGTSVEDCSNKETVTLEVSECTGIKQNFQQNQIKVFPNPASDQITVEFADLGEPIQIQIVNMLGEVMMNVLLSESSVKLNIESLKAGVYFMRTGNSTTQVKLIKE